MHKTTISLLLPAITLTFPQICQRARLLSSHFLRIIFSLSLISALLFSSACVNHSAYYSADNYQPRHANSILYTHDAVVLSSRDVSVQAPNTGIGANLGMMFGDLFGGIWGYRNSVGSDMGSFLGSILGLFVGYNIEDNANKISAIEYEVQLDTGEKMTIVQTLSRRSTQKYQNGALVQVIDDGRSARIIPAQSDP